jgi:hypothetical protein
MKWGKKGMRNYDRQDKQNGRKKNKEEERGGNRVHIRIFVRNIRSTIDE